MEKTGFDIWATLSCHIKKYCVVLTCETKNRPVFKSKHRTRQFYLLYTEQITEYWMNTGSKK